MAGVWNEQNKVLPGAYINIRTNEPLSITLGERGTVMLLQEMSNAEEGKVYQMTASQNDFPEAVTADEKKLAKEALKNAKTVLIYVLPTGHTAEQLETALEAIKTLKWDTLCYPYDGDATATMKEAIAFFIQKMREEEGVKCQAVLANHAADYEGILQVVQGVIMPDTSSETGTFQMTAAETTAWVAGITAGAGVTTSNTGKIYAGAIDVTPRMTRNEQEAAVKEGKLIFKVDNAQNVSVVYDINSLVTATEEKGDMFKKNRVVRTLDNIANDISTIFESNYVGKINNNTDGQTLLKAALVEYFNTLMTMGAIQNFEADDVSVAKGVDTDAVVVTADIRPLDSVEKIYITVNLA